VTTHPPAIQKLQGVRHPKISDISVVKKLSDQIFQNKFFNQIVACVIDIVTSNIAFVNSER
jgi:hypothetical protein